MAASSLYIAADFLNGGYTIFGQVVAGGCGQGITPQWMQIQTLGDGQVITVTEE